MKEIAIIGPTASGKSALAVAVAKKYNAHILSLDSLAIYRHIDIISAKPTREEMDGISHFGIDLIEPDDTFNAGDYIRLYETTRKRCLEDKKNLIIVGGSSFYLKSILDGLSDEPEYSPQTKERVKEAMRDLTEAHALLHRVDPDTASRILKNDRYRLEKALLLYFETGMSPSAYRTAHRKVKGGSEIRLFEIDIEREALRQRIAARTEAMLKAGAIDEAAALERRYTRAPKSMGSIGIKEILEYLDGKYSKEALKERITTHTAQFAKRQSTFNRHQFNAVTKEPVTTLQESIERYMEENN